MVITVTDDDSDKTTYWAMPDDEIDNGEFDIPEISDITEDEKNYVAVMWKDPKGAKVNRYEVNEHFVYAGCSFGDALKKGGKIVCKEKELYIVLHPKLEWENYHLRELKT